MSFVFNVLISALIISLASWLSGRFSGDPPGSSSPCP